MCMWQMKDTIRISVEGWIWVFNLLRALKLAFSCKEKHYNSKKQTEVKSETHELQSGIKIHRKLHNLHIILNLKAWVDKNTWLGVWYDLSRNCNEDLNQFPGTLLNILVLFDVEAIKTTFVQLIRKLHIVRKQTIKSEDVSYASVVKNWTSFLSNDVAPPTHRNSVWSNRNKSTIDEKCWATS